MSARPTSEQTRAKVLAALPLSIDEKIALDERAWEAWNAAWDATRNDDAANGRRYDKDRYSEAASAARARVYLDALAAVGE